MIGVVGAGAFGTALAVTLAQAGHPVTVWARNGLRAGRLPGIVLPENVTIAPDCHALAGAQVVLLALPMQVLGGFLAEHGAALNGLPLVACCKGLDLATLRGPTAVMASACPASVTAILTGPSFAADIAKGLPTALTLACADPMAEALQHVLSTPTLRLYRTTDVIGAELGGALKNVIAIAAGVVIGAGLGDSARAALMTRGYAEMRRFSTRLGARSETLAGLSGLGDLVLTCTSLQSRNLRFGMAIGSGQAFDQQVTVEGAATATAVVRLAANMALDMPIAAMVARLIAREIPLDRAIHSLMSRPLKEE